MARPEDLVPGNCYFLSGFSDEALLFPSISTLRYVRHEQGDDGRDWWLFEEASPSSATEDSDTTPGRPELLGIQDDQLHEILDFQGLISELSSVAIDHPLHRSDAPSRATLPLCMDFGDLDTQLERFTGDPQYRSVTITVRYTDDGISLGRNDVGQIELAFFPKPRTEGDRELRLRTLFSSRGIGLRVQLMSKVPF